MMGMKKMAALMAGVGMLASGAAQATLIDRGGGLIYDNVLNITWLKDANYAATQYAATGGVLGDADGGMTFSAANTWAANLSFHDSARNVDLTGWRLPTVNPVGASFNYNFSNNGTTDAGYGNTSPNSELAYMYYVNLGNLGYCTPDNGNPSSCVGQAGSGLLHTAPFDNLQSSSYWSGRADTADSAWVFGTQLGSQFISSQRSVLYAWAVHSGDVAAVPEPGSAMLFGLSLTGLAAIRRRRPLADG